MFPHPNTVFEVRTLQNRDLLRKASQERLAKEATRHAPFPSWIDIGSASVSRMLTSISAITATSLSSRRLARAWR
jgi:hypothetical protein